MRVRRRSDGARGIVLRKDEGAALYKVYFLKDAKDWENRKKINVDGKYAKITLRREHLNNTAEYEHEGYDAAWRRGIVFKENVDNKRKYANMSSEEKKLVKDRRNGLKDARIQKLKSGEAPISS